MLIVIQALWKVLSPLLLTGVFLSGIVKSLRADQLKDLAIVYKERVVFPEATELEKGLQRKKKKSRLEL